MTNLFALILLAALGAPGDSAASLAFIDIQTGGDSDAHFAMRVEMPAPLLLSGDTARMNGEFKGLDETIRVDGNSESAATLEAILSLSDHVLSKTSTKIKLPARDWVPFSLNLTVPEIKKQIEAKLTARWKGGSSISYPVALFPRGPVRDTESLTRQKRIGIVDPAGTLDRYLSTRGIRHDLLSTRLSMRAFQGDVVIINSRYLGGTRDSLLDVFESNVRQGLSVIVLEPESIPPRFRNGMDVMDVPSVAAAEPNGHFFNAHPLTYGLGEPPMGNWIRNWRPDGRAARAAISPPLEGNYRVIAKSVQSPDSGALILEIPEGRGRFVFSSLRTGLEDTQTTEPLAALILDNLIFRSLDAPPETWRRMALVYDTSEEGEPGNLLFPAVGQFGDSNPNFEDTYPLWLFDGRGEFLENFTDRHPRVWMKLLKRIEEGGETLVFLNVDRPGWELISNRLTDIDLKIGSKVSPDSTPPDFACIPYRDGEIYLVRLDLSKGQKDETRRLWLNLLTGWGVEVRSQNSQELSSQDGQIIRK